MSVEKQKKENCCEIGVFNVNVCRFFNERRDAMKKKNFEVLIGVFVFVLLCNYVSADLVHVGTYQYTTYPGNYGESYNTPPYKGPYDTNSVQGDGAKDDDLDTALFSGTNFESDSDGEYAQITFDLEGDYCIADVTSYHYLRSEWWAVGAVKFYYSTDGTNYVFVGSDGTDQKGDPAQLVSRTMDYGDVQARYVRMKCYRAFGDHLPLGEVEIDATAVPEPATIGFVLLGLVGLFRKK